MLSSFLKKLLFARQLFLIEGKVELLGVKQVILSSNIINASGDYKAMKSAAKSNFESYMKKIGASPEGMLKSITDLFNSFGLGTIRLVKLDRDKKSAVVEIKNNPVKINDIPRAILAGIFSFGFKKDVEAEVKGNLFEIK